MPNVLIHGATGQIGNTFAQTLVRSGNHTVYGIARTEEKARGLAALEIHPVLSEDPVNNPKPWVDVLTNERIDIVVDAASYYADTLKVLDHVKEAGNKRVQTAQSEDVVLSKKLGFIYVSGVWVHGDSMARVSDVDPVGVASAPSPPVEMVAARPGWEQAILKSRDTLDVAIVRPAMVYGYQSWVLSSLLDPILEAKSAESIKIPTVEDAYPSFVHVEDLAAGMQGVVEQLQVLNTGHNIYPVFDLGTSQENLGDVIKAFAKVMGHQGKIEFIGHMDHPFLKALATSLNLDCSRAKTLLGWQPKKVGVLSKVKDYALAWKAHKEQSK